MKGGWNKTLCRYVLWTSKEFDRVSWMKLLDNLDWRDMRLIMQVNVGQTPEVKLAAGLSDHSSWIVVRIKDVCYNWHSFNMQRSMAVEKWGGDGPTS